MVRPIVQHVATLTERAQRSGQQAGRPRRSRQVAACSSNQRPSGRQRRRARCGRPQRWHLPSPRSKRTWRLSSRQCGGRAVAAQGGLASLCRLLGSSPHIDAGGRYPLGVGVGKRRWYATIFSVDRPRSRSISTERRGWSLSRAGFTPRSSSSPWPLPGRPLVFTCASSVSSRQAGGWPGTGLFSRRSPGASSMPEFWQRPDAVRGGLSPSRLGQRDIPYHVLIVS